jgi:hypothetical protein
MELSQAADDRTFRCIPEHHRRSHEFCWYVYRHLAQMLIQHDEVGAHRVVSDAFRAIAKEQGQNPSEVDMLNFLQDNGFGKEYRFHLISNLALALTADMLRYLHEGLRALQECHFSIAFTLLRKPFKENLIFLAWLLGGEEDFLQNFSANNYKTLNRIGEEDQLKILSDAIGCTVTPGYFDATLMREAVFSKQQEFGLEPLWQKATHLITSQGSLLRTPDYSINFIFEPADSEHYYNILYQWLPDLFLLTSQIVPECLMKSLHFNEVTYSHHLVTTIGYYEALGHAESGAGISQVLNTAFRSFLKCGRCGEQLLISNSNACRLYEIETIRCDQCGGDTQVPLFWLMSFGKMKASREGIKIGDIELGSIDELNAS